MLTVRPMRTAIFAAAATLVVLVGPSAMAMFMRPEPAPVDRLTKNLLERVKEDPEDAEGYYLLGRAHYLAASLKTHLLGTYTDRQAGKVTTVQQLWGKTPNDPEVKPPTEKELVEHTEKAIKYLRQAIDLDEENGLYHLTLASALEVGVEHAPAIGAPPGDPRAEQPLEKEDTERYTKLISQLAPPPFVDTTPEMAELAEKSFQQLRDELWQALPVLVKHRKSDNEAIDHKVGQLFAIAWREAAIESNAQAYKLTVKKDAKLRYKPLRGIQSLVSYESAEHYRDLIATRDASEDEKKLAKEMADHLKKLRELPMGAITPIVFSLDAGATLADTLATDQTVAFDLDGDRRVEKRTWVKPDTGILCWDPLEAGHIRSGRQLFGSVTWWLFWKDGYGPLDALDDNRDGKLAGDELRGIAVWFDRNSNGISDKGEVTPVEAFGIQWIATHPTSHDGDSPTARRGIGMTNGNILPTFDWIAE